MSLYFCETYSTLPAADPHFDPHRKAKICNKKHLKSSDFRCFLELLGGFEPPASSLPRDF